MSDPDTYDLAPDPADAPAGAPSDRPAAAPAAPARPVLYQTVRQRARDDYDVTEGRAPKNLYLPIVLMLVGCGAVFGRLMYFEFFGKRLDAAGAWSWTGFMLAWNIGVML